MLRITAKIALKTPRIASTTVEKARSTEASRSSITIPTPIISSWPIGDSAVAGWGERCCVVIPHSLLS